MSCLNIVYLEPESDRWLPFDRYPRRFVRRLVRNERPSGHKKVFWNLVKGLEAAGIPHRVNDVRHIEKNPEEPVCLLGKPFVLDEYKWKNPILLGPCIFSHPCDHPDLLQDSRIERMIVPCEWNRAMWAEGYGDRVVAWPVGIDTDNWVPLKQQEKQTDVLLYNKIRWECERFDRELAQPIRNELDRHKLSWVEIRYGAYEEDELRKLVRQCRSVVFLCEHETQGIALQEMLAADLPAYVWERRGFWQDPNYYPERVQFQPVSTVPYWDKRCGDTFAGLDEFRTGLSGFMERVGGEGFDPRSFVLESLTLDKCAREYARLHDEVFGAVR